MWNIQFLKASSVSWKCFIRKLCVWTCITACIVLAFTHAHVCVVFASSGLRSQVSCSVRFSYLFFQFSICQSPLQGFVLCHLIYSLLPVLGSEMAYFIAFRLVTNIAYNKYYCSNVIIFRRSAKDMTALLNKLIKGYDNRLRPNFGGKHDILPCKRCTS